MRVYEISDKGGRIPSEPRTEKPMTRVMFSIFKSLKEEDCTVTTLCRSLYAHPCIYRPTLQVPSNMLLIEIIVKGGILFHIFREKSVQGLICATKI